MSDEEAVRSALTIPAVLDSEEQKHEISERLNEQIASWLSDPPRIEHPLDAWGSATFYLAYYGEDVRPLHEKIAQFYLAACPALQFTAAHCTGARAREGKLRVGFVSRYFLDHTVSKLTAGLISALPAPEFETTLIRFPSKLTRLFDAVRILKHAPHIKQIEDLSYPEAHQTVDVSKDIFEAREQIAALGLDVLVYPDVGMEPHTYFLSLARLAPVQCAMWGHPVTTGVPAVDYFISADVLEPPGAEAVYSERLVRMNRLPTYYLRPPAPDDSFSRGDFGGDRIYACPQSPFKFLPAFDAALAQLLDADPGATLLLLGNDDDERVVAVRRRMARTLGDTMARVRFLSQMDRRAFLSALRGVDALLDPFQFGGGNTTYEALSLGAPIVTMPGRFMRGRITAACYEQMGVKDLVAEDIDAYVTMATALARDADMRAQKRAEIVEKGDQLFEDRLAVDVFQDFLRNAQ